MKLYVLGTTDPHYNLALEEYLFERGEGDAFLLWQNAPTVVIGKNQNAHAELHIDECRRRGIRIARRITGGGAVYHDMGNLNYSYIASGTGTLDFARFEAPIIAALSRVGVAATASGRNDLLVDGRKFSGNAQHSKNGRTLHHGTLLFDTDLSVLSSVLAVDAEKLKANAVRSVASRVTNLKEHLPVGYTVDDLIALIAGEMREHYGATLAAPPTSAEIDALAARNASAAWLFPDRDYLSRYTYTKKKRFPFGMVELSLSMKNEQIEEARITGDFFGTAPVTLIEAALAGQTLATAPAAIMGLPLGDCIAGMTEEDFLSLLSK